jgi:hypothetical protein
MQRQPVFVYINDHVAGSVATLELREHLISAHDAAQPLESFFVDLEREIKSDQVVLKQLLGVAEQKPSLFRNVVGWITEKFARSKMKLAGQNMGGLGLVQAVEMLALGIRAANNCSGARWLLRTGRLCKISILHVWNTGRLNSRNAWRNSASWPRAKHSVFDERQ